MRHLGLLIFLSLCLAGCAAKPPELKLFFCKDYPVFAPSSVESAMGAQTADSMNDPNANHHLTYWLHCEAKPEAVVKFYREKMASLPSAKEVTGEDKFEDSLFQMKSGPTSAADKVVSVEVIIDKEEKNGKTVLRLTETLKPGLKYPD